MNYLKTLGTISLFLVIWGSSVKTANIVGFYTFDIKSHYLFAQSFLKELAKSGHNVTVFTGFKSQNLPENYREVPIKLGSLDGI